MRTMLLVLVSCVLAVGAVQAADREFLELYTFGDTAKALAMLTPGSEEYYFYNALFAFKQNDMNAYNRFIAEFTRDHKYSQQLAILKNRELMARYAKDSKTVVAELVRRFGLTFTHTRPGLKGAADADLPTQLDQGLIAADNLFRQYSGQYNFESLLTQEGLNRLFLTSNTSRKADLILASRIRDPLLDGVVGAIVYILKNPKMKYSFGQIPITSALVQAQLDEIITQVPAVLEDESFVGEYMRRLLAPADAREDERDAQIVRQRAFAARLNDKFNSLKARLCYALLDRNLDKGVYDKALFTEYLQYPRSSEITAGKFLSKFQQAARADLNIDTQAFTGLDRIYGDRELVTAYLEYLFQQAAGDDKVYEPFLAFLDKDYVLETFAAARILAGNDDPRYFNMLPAYKREELVKRVEVNILRTTHRIFGRSETVALDLGIKNASKVYLKIYRINGESFMRKNSREPDEFFDVFGIVPNAERTLSFEKSASTRTVQTLAFPELKDAGFYLVDIIGNGKYARAVVKKGTFHLVSRPDPKGIILTVFNENLVPVAGAQVYVETHAYTTDAAGSVLVPFSTSPRTQTAVIVKDGVAALGTFNHMEAAYALQAAMHLEQEALVPGNLASVLIAPRLTCNGEAADIRQLANVSVRITVRGRDGIETSNVTRDIKLTAGRDYAAEFRVPDFAQTVSAVIEGEVSLPWQNEPLKLNDSAQFTVSLASEPVRIMDAYFSSENGAYVLYFLGRNGEPVPRLDADVRLHHRYFTNPETIRLQADADGRIMLGALADIGLVTVYNRTFNFSRRFEIAPSKPFLPRSLTLTRAAAMNLPLQVKTDCTAGAEQAVADLQLIRTVQDVNVENCTSALAYTDGQVVLNNLAAGCYRLRSLTAGIDTELTILAAELRAGYAVDDRAAVYAAPLSALVISAVEETAQGLKVKLAGSSAETRVHVSGRLFNSNYTMFEALKGVLDHTETAFGFREIRNTYVSARDLDPEYMYILARQDDTAYVGNLLERPGLILNRIETKPVDTQVFAPAPAAAEAGMGYGGRDGAGRRKSAMKGGGSAASEGPAWRDFLAEPALVVFNLKPDKDGMVTIPKGALGSCRFIDICAVDASTAVGTRFRRAATAAIVTNDLRLAAPLDITQVLGQKSTCRGFSAGQTLLIRNRASSDFVVFRTVGELYRYLMALGSSDLLREFEFVTGWASLTEDEKREKYSKYACHELSFFIFKKDKPFFDKVIKPYLANKMHKTFLDLYLLGADLSGFTREEAYNRLNLFERVLLGRTMPGFTPSFVNDLFRPDAAAEELAIETALGVFGLETAPGESLANKRQVEKDKADRSENESVRQLGNALRARKAMKEEAKSMALADEETAADGFMDAMAAAAPEPRMYFKNVDKTKEYMENNWYGRTPAQASAEMISPNRFWYDLAAQGDGPFLPSNVGTIGRDFPALMLVLALVDLPFDDPQHAVDMEGGKAQIAFKGNALVFLKEIAPLDKAETGVPVMVKNRYFYLRDLDKREEDRRSVTGEFLPSEIYYNDITVVNPSDRYRECDLFIQIPAGSIAFNLKGDILRRKISLSPYAVINERVFFYFPQVGQFVQYPPQVYDLEGAIAAGDVTRFDVKAELTVFDTESWEYIAAAGDQAKIFAYLDKANLQDTDLDLVNYLLKDKAFYTRLAAFCAARHHVDLTVCAYAFLHGDEAGMRCYLKQSDLNNTVGWYFTSPLLAINPVTEKWYQHLEYDPLVIPRAHSLAGKTGIDVPVMQNQYGQFLEKISHKDRPDADDLMQYAYYLLLQNRIGEAMDLFGRVKRTEVTPVMQYDYMACYIAFFREDTAGARKVAQGYVQYPVPKWQKLFAEVLTQLDEAEGKGRTAADDSREAKLAGLAGKEVTLELDEKDGKVMVRGANLDAIVVKLFLIDVETLFSSNPFDQGLSDRFSYVTPATTFSIPVRGGMIDTELKIPKDFQNRDLFVEAASKGKVRSRLVFSNDLNVQVFENYGRIKVASVSNGKPIKKVYVKVYGKKNGSAVFYKDGYTDLRGVFDYASLSSDLIDQVTEYAVLILSDKHGSRIVQTAPPKR